MIPFWKNIPLLRQLLPLIAGIIIGWHAAVPWQTAVMTGVTGIFIFSAFVFLSQKTKYLFGWLAGMSTALTLAALGMLLTWLHQAPHQSSWLGHRLAESEVIELVLQEPPVEKSNTWKVTAAATAIYTRNQKHNTTGKVIIYFPKDDNVQQLQYGSVLYTRLLPTPIMNAGNPGGFNFKRYALFNGITHQLFLRKKEYLIGSENKGHHLRALLYRSRAYVLHTLEQYISGDQEKAVAQALLAGYRDNLDRDLVQSFSNTGVVHIIAVSGMHLGLLYVLLLFLLRPLNAYPRLRVTKVVFILTLLWTFSLFTGASASVLRAVIMFSFVIAGDLLQRNGNVYNSLAASAYLLLCFNPFLLWDVGFRLSYAAVLSIVLFMKPIYDLLYIQNPLLKGLWKLSSITLSAQILTLPLCIYHFHQSPNLFLIANLVAVPLGTVSLYGALLLVGLAPLPFLAQLQGQLLNQLLSWMNQYVLWVDRFHFSVTEGIWHHPLQTLLLYGIIAALAVGLLQRRKSALLAALSCLVLFLSIVALQHYQRHIQHLLIVYNIPKHQAIELVAGRRLWYRGSTTLLQDGFLRNFHIKPSRIANGTYHSNLQLLKEPFIRTGNKTLFFIDAAESWQLVHDSMRADVAVISNQKRIHPNQLDKLRLCGTVVFDSSNPAWQLQQWKYWSDSLQLNSFFTNLQGAFVMRVR